DVNIFPRGRIIGEDDGFNGPYYSGQPQWLRMYEERRRRAEDAGWGDYRAGRFDYLGRRSPDSDPWSRPYDPTWAASSYNYERAQRHRERLAMTPFATHVHRVNGQIWETTQMKNGDVYRVARPLPTSTDGSLHDVRFVDGYKLD